MTARLIVGRGELERLGMAALAGGEATIECRYRGEARFDFRRAEDEVELLVHLAVDSIEVVGR